MAKVQWSQRNHFYTELLASASLKKSSLLLWPFSNGISHSGETVFIKIVSADIIFNYIIHTTDRVYGLPQTSSLQGGMIMSEIPLLNHLACTKNLCK